MLRVSNNIEKRLARVTKVIDDNNIARVAYEKFYDTTPEDTGNARRNTNLKSNVIEANYEYAGVLNRGRHMTPRGPRGSNQAPRGMLEPTIEYVREYIRSQLGINVKGK